MIYLEHNDNDLFVLSQKILACLLSEIQAIPQKAGILMFVESSFFGPGFQRQVEKHLREIISDDRRLSGLAGMDIKVTVETSELFTNSNVIGLVFDFS